LCAEPRREAFPRERPASGSRRLLRLGAYTGEKSDYPAAAGPAVGEHPLSEDTLDLVPKPSSAVGNPPPSEDNFDRPASTTPTCSGNLRLPALLPSHS